MKQLLVTQGKAANGTFTHNHRIIQDLVIHYKPSHFNISKSEFDYKVPFYSNLSFRNLFSCNIRLFFCYNRRILLDDVRLIYVSKLVGQYSNHLQNVL